MKCDDFFSFLSPKAKCLPRVGAGAGGAPTAMCSGLQPHGEDVETGLHREEVVHGIREEVISDTNEFWY